ncbi:Oxysterols receptor LXR-alpha [Homalodisca vitripennis]|nr:Oxysterols receptor LXR-alpha [Homalodisca vitripennis]
MDLKHDLVYSRGGSGGGMLLSDDIIKSEPRLHSPPGEASGSNVLFCSFTQATKRRVDDWVSSPSPNSQSHSTPAPATPSPGPPSHPYTVISNGYSSPPSSGSYDPYSPNGKIVLTICRDVLFSARILPRHSTPSPACFRQGPLVHGGPSQLVQHRVASNKALGTETLFFPLPPKLCCPKVKRSLSSHTQLPPAQFPQLTNISLGSIPPLPQVKVCGWLMNPALARRFSRQIVLDPTESRRQDSNRLTARLDSDYSCTHFYVPLCYSTLHVTARRL